MSESITGKTIAARGSSASRVVLLDSAAEVQETEAAIEQQGARIIHISSENKVREKRWFKFLIYNGRAGAGPHLIRFRGVLAPNAKLRREIIPSPPEQEIEVSTDDAPTQGAPARMSWARLLKRSSTSILTTAPTAAAA